jgi:uncharacterized protein (TIGR00369 family)
MLEPRNPEFAAFVARYVGAQGYLALLGVVLGPVAPGRVEYHLPFRPDLGQQDGVFHGGVIGGLAEGVMGAAAASLVAAGSNVVGAEYKVNLMAPGAGTRLIAVGEVIRAGRRLVVCRADVFCPADAADATAAGTTPPIAIAQGTMAVV